MRHVEVGGESISAVGLGTWQFGSKEWGYGDEYARDEAARIVARALDLGVNLFDSAEMYGGGLSEEILGRALDGAAGTGLHHHQVLPTAAPPRGR